MWCGEFIHSFKPDRPVSPLPFRGRVHSTEFVYLILHFVINGSRASYEKLGHTSRDSFFPFRCLPFDEPPFLGIRNQLISHFIFRIVLNPIAFLASMASYGMRVGIP